MPIDIPIIYTGPMVRGLQAGTKTMTRRIMKPQPTETSRGWLWRDYEWGADKKRPINALTGGSLQPCPYGQPGDRHWVRETWAPDPPCDGTWGYTAWAGSRIGQIAGVPERFRHARHCIYAANWEHAPIRWTPPIHMPRWASRITLEVVRVRVERLQDITEADAIAEGCIDEGSVAVLKARRNLMAAPDVIGVDGKVYPNAIAAFRALWERINGAGSWAANPWVWVIEFKPFGAT